MVNRPIKKPRYGTADRKLIIIQKKSSPTGSIFFFVSFFFGVFQHFFEKGIYEEHGKKCSQERREV